MLVLNKTAMKKKVLVCVAFIVLVVVLGCVAYARYHASAAIPVVSPEASALRTITLDGQTIDVSIADTVATRELGLGGRAGLAPNEGMLFVFPQDGIYAFWMKDMRFSIDMIWFSDSGAVVYMAQNVSPDTYPNAFVPTVPARYVLELPAGYAKEYNVKIGDVAQL